MNHGLIMALANVYYVAEKNCFWKMTPSQNACLCWDAYTVNHYYYNYRHPTTWDIQDHSGRAL